MLKCRLIKLKLILLKSMPQIHPKFDVNVTFCHGSQWKMALFRNQPLVKYLGIAAF